MRGDVSYRNLPTNPAPAKCSSFMPQHETPPCAIVAMQAKVLAQFWARIAGHNQQGTDMRKFSLGLVLISFAMPFSVGAQVALKADTPSLLFWTPAQQSSGYRSIEN